MAQTDEKFDYAKALAKANEKNSRLEKQIRGYKGLLARRSVPQNGNIPADTTTEAHKSEETSVKPHFVGHWQRYCPECGEQNPDFKDEIECEGCGMHLGAKEDAVKLKACPNCGSKKAKEIERTEHT